MPYSKAIKIDRWGYEDGSYFNVIFLNKIKYFMKNNGISFMLQSSLSNPEK